MNYEIKKNEEFNSTEIYFDCKPSEKVRDALKEKKYRWHKVKKCWYGKLSESDVRNLLDNISEEKTEITVKATDGYMGATEFTGCNYKPLWGSDLTKAIRGVFKEYDVKGCSVSCHSYSGGQSITVKVKADSSDYMGKDEYIDSYDYEDMCPYNSRWYLDLNGKSTHIDNFYTLGAEEQKKTLKFNAEADFDEYRNHPVDVYGGRIDNYKIFTDKFKSKVNLIQNILDSFNHDDSNSMVDYFDKHFYETITIIPAE